MPLHPQVSERKHRTSYIGMDTESDLHNPKYQPIITSYDYYRPENEHRFRIEDCAERRGKKTVNFADLLTRPTIVSVYMKNNTGSCDKQNISPRCRTGSL